MDPIREVSANIQRAGSFSVDGLSYFLVALREILGLKPGANGPACLAAAQLALRNAETDLAGLAAGAMQASCPRAGPTQEAWRLQDVATSASDGPQTSRSCGAITAAAVLGFNYQTYIENNGQPPAGTSVFDNFENWVAPQRVVQDVFDADERVDMIARINDMLGQEDAVVAIFMHGNPNANGIGHIFLAARQRGRPGWIDLQDHADFQAEEGYGINSWFHGAFYGGEIWFRPSGG